VWLTTLLSVQDSLLTCVNSTRVLLEAHSVTRRKASVWRKSNSVPLSGSVFKRHQSFNQIDASLLRQQLQAWCIVCQNTCMHSRTQQPSCRLIQ
jgi:hypothetical protein